MPLFLPPSASSLPPTLFFVAILAVGSFGCADEESRRGRERPQPAVEVVQARVGALPLEERLSGVVRAENQVAVRAEISALVTEVLVRTGDAVEAGEALVRLDAQGPRERLRQGEAAVRLAAAQAAEAEARVVELVAQVSRTRALADDDLVSELALETQEARLEAARAAAAQAAARVDEARATAEERRADLAKTVVRAPVEGRVGRRRVEVGSQVDSSTLLFELGSLDNLVVEVPLTEEMLTVLREGQSALVRPSDGGEPIRARLDRVSPFLSAGSFSTTGEIDLGDAGARLRPGTFVTVDILYGESERATLVPISALWEDPRTGMLGLYVVGEDPSAGPSSASTGVSSGALPAASSARETDGYASDIDRDVVFQPVTVVAEGRATAGVAGLEPDRWVVTVGQHLLRSGEPMPARVRPTTWERVIGLQSLEREDVLERFLDKQRRLARGGAEPPAIEKFLGDGAGEGRRRPVASDPARGGS